MLGSIGLQRNTTIKKGEGIKESFRLNRHTEEEVMVNFDDGSEGGVGDHYDGQLWYY